MISISAAKRNIPFILLCHILAWTLYCIYIFFINYMTNKEIKVIEIIFYVMPFGLAFYTSLYSLKLFKKKGVLYGLGSFFCFFIILSSASYYYIYHLLPSSDVTLYDATDDLKVFIRVAIFGYIRFTVYALLYFVIKNSFEKERQLRSLQEEKFALEQEKKQQELQNALLVQQELISQQERLQFEYAFLRAQINPHFLHNTLNVLYSQALNYSDELAENILKLSHMMRYALESLEHESGKVSIQKELSQLQTLIDINYLRFGNIKAVEYTLEGEMADQMLPPLSIISIVENAFKYGDLKDLKNPLQIKVKLQLEQIYFFCRNKKRKSSIELTSHHIGITNLSKRLDVVFKDKYEINAINEDEFYTFELTINN